MPPTASDHPFELAWLRAFGPDTPYSERSEAFAHLVTHFDGRLRRYAAAHSIRLSEEDDEEAISDMWFCVWAEARSTRLDIALPEHGIFRFLQRRLDLIRIDRQRHHHASKRDRRRVSRTPQDLDTLPSSVGDPAEESETGELFADFRDALDELPDAERLVIIMRYFADYTLSEIAGSLHSSLDHTSRLLTRARVRLANRLSRFADLPSAPPVDFVPDTRAQGQPYRHWGQAPTRMPVPTQKAPPARPATAPLDLQLVGEFTPEQVRQVLDAVATAVRAAGGHGVQVVGPATHTAVPACVVASGGPLA